MNKRLGIGILGGTFDPIHRGHLSIAEQVFHFFHLQQMLFIPNNTPALRNAPSANAIHRRKMVELAIADQPHYCLDTRELERTGTSFAIDTLISIRQDFPTEPLLYIIGADAFNQFDQWHRWQEILHYVNLVVINRPGYTLSDAPWMRILLTQHQTQHPSHMTQALAGKIFLFTIAPLTVSATQIRQDFQKQQPDFAEVPVAVKNYILQNKLYGY